MTASSKIIMPNLLALCAGALTAAEDYLERARHGIASRVVVRSDGKSRLSDAEQLAAHGYAWNATYVAALAGIFDWARRAEVMGRFGESEHLILQAAYGEYLAQLLGGIPLSQSEIARPADLGSGDAAVTLLQDARVAALIERGNTAHVRASLAARLLQSRVFGDPGIDDDALIETREQTRRFAETRIGPTAHTWHRENRLIPVEIINELAQLGVFGLTISEQHGGLGLGKLAMCLMTEELSRVSLAVGSLGTRSEIAAELIGSGGTQEQNARWLPGIASGKVLPAAVFTEPSCGSDLSATRTRAIRAGAIYLISGAKTWITHAARADLMTVLARTGSADSGYKGLSMFLASKPRGTDADPFPVAGLRGSEIPVLGYRGMKEYEIVFDEFGVPAGNLLGESEGHGFKQLMATFESARIQTAARAVGVAQNALELALAYSSERRQFNRRIVEFPRIAGKIAWMAIETMLARQLTYCAARAKDRGQRCDVQAGMAKLLAARVAWSNADSALQIHGGNGYAEEYAISRVLCDARILSIFEGSAEIQADVVARGLLLPAN